MSPVNRTRCRGVRQAAQQGFTDLCWSLAFSAADVFEIRAYLDDWRQTHEIALTATRKAGHVRGQAAMLYAIGSLQAEQRQFDPPVRHSPRPYGCSRTQATIRAWPSQPPSSQTRTG